MPTKSSFPSVPVPDGDTWAFLFERTDRPFPDDKELFVDAETSRAYTYAQLRQTAAAFGEGLKASWSWRKGDVLAIYAQNDIDFPPVFWGCQWAGGVVTTANAAYTAGELAAQLKDAGARALVTQAPILNAALDAARLAAIPEDRILLLGTARDESARFQHFTSVSHAAAGPRLERIRCLPDDLAVLVYSSGTTGPPKGVMLTHQSLCVNILQVVIVESHELRWDGQADGMGDRVLGFLPFFHIYGLSSLLLHCAYRGWTLVVMPRFELEPFCQVIQSRRITFLYIVPPVLLLLAQHPAVAKYDLSSLRMLNSGAAPLTPSLVKAVHTRLGVPTKQGYGLSESGPVATVQPWSEWHNMGSVGRLVSNTEAKHVDTGGRELPPGAVGELWLRGPGIFRGYLNNEEGTRAALAADGWLRTGDIGYQDPDGQFYITDRAKDFIKYKGFQVPPFELESLLLSNERVSDCAVVGVYDAQQATELPVAFVVAAPGVETTEAAAGEIAAWVAGRVAPHKQLRGGVRIVDGIPKSASGKILRRELRDSLTAETNPWTEKPKL